VKTLSAPDDHLVREARGGLEQSAWDQAKAALDQVSYENRNHPDVLESRWALAAKTGQWQEALAVSEQLCYLYPDRVEGWIFRGTSFVELSQYADAYKVLRQGQERFPNDDTLAYDLACVCCALARLDEALTWIRRSIEIGGAEISGCALEDADLKPIAIQISAFLSPPSAPAPPGSSFL
jgi:tetratricopeptide (TPR) repeat protein